jgi:hypothetical protein
LPDFALRLFFHHGVVRIPHRWLLQSDVGREGYALVAPETKDGTAACLIL